MRPARLIPYLAALSLAGSVHGQALAGQGDGSDPIAERTGPNASQALPDFATPQDQLTLPTEARPTLPPAQPGSIWLAHIEVSGDDAVRGVFLPGWAGIEDSINGFRVSPSAEGPFDGAWIARQFTDNGLIGSEVGFDRISAMIQLINRAFIANGYINSGILVEGLSPDNQSLILRLVAGRIQGTEQDDIVVSWSENRSRGLSSDFIRSRMPAATMRPFNAINVEREFRLLAEDSAIRTINADLQPGAAPGEARLALTVDPQRRFDVYVSAANDRSPAIGGERFAIGGSMRNAVFSGDIVSVEAGLVGNRGDVVAGYETSIIDPATRLSVRGGYNDAAVIDSQLRPLNIEASDWHIEAGLSRALLREPLSPRLDGGWRAARSFRIGAYVAHRRSTSRLLGRRFSFSPGSVNGRAEYTVTRLTADYLQRGINSVFAASLTGTQGLSGTRSTLPGLISPDENFRSIRSQLSFARRLGDKGWEVRTRLAAQWADGILYSGERFSVGGQQTVRGYRETLILADTGVAGSVELLRHFSLSGQRRSGGTDWGAFTVSAFVDGAFVDNREGGQPIADDIGSIGASLAWTPSDAIAVQLTYAHALTDVAQTGERDMQDRGIHFRIVLRPLAF